MEAEEDQRCAGNELAQLPRRLKTVEERHGDVENDSIGAETHYRFHQGFTICGLTYHVKIGLKQRAQAPQNKGVVIGEKNTRSLHGPLTDKSPCS